MVAEQSVTKPDDALRIESFAQRRLGLFFRPPRIAVRVKHALSGGDENALTVLFHSAAFKDEVETLERVAFQPRNGRSGFCVAFQLVLAAPAIEGEAKPLEPVAELDEDRPDIAQPDIAHGGIVEFCQVPDRHDRGQRLDQRCDLALGAFIVFGPGVAQVRPANPDSRLGRPFRRGVSECSRLHGARLAIAS